MFCAIPMLCICVQLELGHCIQYCDKERFFYVYVCVSVLYKRALLHNHVSRDMCECLCVRVKPRGALTQAEDRVKCFIFRCVKLFHFPLSVSTGAPLSSTHLNLNKRKHSDTTSKTPPKALRQIFKWGKKMTTDKRIHFFGHFCEIFRC